MGGTRRHYRRADRPVDENLAGRDQYRLLVSPHADARHRHPQRGRCSYDRRSCAGTLRGERLHPAAHRLAAETRDPIPHRRTVQKDRRQPDRRRRQRGAEDRIPGRRPASCRRWHPSRHPAALSLATGRARTDQDRRLALHPRGGGAGAGRGSGRDPGARLRLQARLVAAATGCRQPQAEWRPGQGRIRLDLPLRQHPRGARTARQHHSPGRQTDRLRHQFRRGHQPASGAAGGLEGAEGRPLADARS